jgi:uncharacterized hydrophobic protein (TIGR00271 family)
MPEESNQKNGEATVENTKQRRNLRRTFVLFASSLWEFLRTTMTLKKGVDFAGAAEGIKRDIDFKGHNVWILICSIFIASIGLNVNSTALIIGAMLISPLMGPILGIGLAVGTNDLKTMTRSLKSLGVAAGISILTSMVYFLITPLGEVQSELIARTKPTLLDVLVAIAGGLAGVIAWTRKERNTNVIPGVAIATALMPPLCTAGFALAKGKWDFFLGASYLFLINSVFISLATLVIVRFLKFPMVDFVDSMREKRVKRYISLAVILVCIPSAFTFWSAIQEGIFKSNAEKFISESFMFENSDIINSKVTYNDDEPSRIEVYLLGNPLSDQTVRELKQKLSVYGLHEAELKIYQNKNENSDLEGKISQNVKTGIIEEMYEKNAKKLAEKDEVIHELENELVELQGKQIPFSNIKREVKIQYDDVVKMGYANAIETDFSEEQQDTVPTFFIRWKSVEDQTEAEVKRRSLEKWLRVRLENNRLRVVNY